MTSYEDRHLEARHNCIGKPGLLQWTLPEDGNNPGHYTCIPDAAVLDNKGRIGYIFSTLLVA